VAARTSCWSPKKTNGPWRNGRRDGAHRSAAIRSVSLARFVRRLFKKFQGDSQVQTYFQVIINEVERLEKTLNEILDFSAGYAGAV